MALGPTLSDTLSPRQASAVSTAIVSLIDDFFADVARLLDGEDFSDTTMADFLPRKYLSRYSTRFAQQFLVCAITAADKLTAADPRRLACVAEELALAAILDQALVVLDLDDESMAGDREAIAKLADEIFVDRDFDLLSDLALDGMEDAPASERLAVSGLGFEEWFTPFRPEEPVHSYLGDRPARS